MKITYEDKINTKTSALPRRNKATADDFNEIKEVVNANGCIPIGSGVDYYGDELPSNEFVWADGSALSREDYAELFAVIGTIYGAGDGETTFNVPDKRNRVSAMRTTGKGLGTKIGNDTHKHLEPFIVDNETNWTKFQWNTGLGYGTIDKTSANTNAINNTPSPTAFSGKQLYNQPVSSWQPTLICNYIIRAK